MNEISYWLSDDKISGWCSITILIAQYLGFENFVSAGILTILCIQVTKKKSLRASWDRILACLFAIVYAIVFLKSIAYHPARHWIIASVFYSDCCDV